MRYEKIEQGIFHSRPNRFVAKVFRNGELEVCHVKNTGRCKELLLPGTRVILSRSSNPNRKTRYDLVAVEKAGRWINMDSQAPNKVVGEWLANGNLFAETTRIQPEKKIGNSRIDFYVEAEGKRIFIEVKGVTLEEKGVARFPDAPTERGIKHIKELQHLREEGYETYILFVIQMKGVTELRPNDVTHPAFGEALREAAAEGVQVLAYDCMVTQDSLSMDAPVPVVLEGPKE